MHACYFVQFACFLFPGREGGRDSNADLVKGGCASPSSSLRQAGHALPFSLSWLHFVGFFFGSFSYACRHVDFSIVHFFYFFGS